MAKMFYGRVSFLMRKKGQTEWSTFGCWYYKCDYYPAATIFHWGTVFAEKIEIYKNWREFEYAIKVGKNLFMMVEECYNIRAPFTILGHAQP